MNSLLGALTMAYTSRPTFGATHTSAASLPQQGFQRSARVRVPELRVLQASTSSCGSLG